MMVCLQCFNQFIKFRVSFFAWQGTSYVFLYEDFYCYIWININFWGTINIHKKMCMLRSPILVLIFCIKIKYVPNRVHAIKYYFAKYLSENIVNLSSYCYRISFQPQDFGFPVHCFTSSALSLVPY